MTAQESEIRWHKESRDCPHINEHACPFCDFDGYYANTYPDCPWRDDECHDS